MQPLPRARCFRLPPHTLPAPSAAPPALAAAVAPRRPAAPASAAALPDSPHSTASRRRRRPARPRGPKARGALSPRLRRAFPGSKVWGEGWDGLAGPAAHSALSPQLRGAFPKRVEMWGKCVGDSSFETSNATCLF
eukprot:266080-Chlamydomonas_euryale.AAC.1